VFAKKGETLSEYWDYTHRLFTWQDSGTPNLILDDGGDATLLIHLGCEAETDPAVLDRQTESEEETSLLASIKRTLAKQPHFHGRAVRLRQLP